MKITAGVEPIPSVKEIKQFLCSAQTDEDREKAVLKFMEMQDIPPVARWEIVNNDKSGLRMYVIAVIWYETNVPDNFEVRP